MQPLDALPRDESTTGACAVQDSLHLSPAQEEALIKINNDVSTEVFRLQQSQRQILQQIHVRPVPVRSQPLLLLFAPSDREAAAEPGNPGG